MARFLERLGLKYPIVQAPMAGVSTPAMASAVSNAGALGSIAVGAVSVDVARQTIRETKGLTNRAFNVNVFCHQRPVRDEAKESRWLLKLASEFERYGAKAPSSLKEIYKSFVHDPDMLAMLLEEKPAVVSFHFGLPGREAIDRLKAAGVYLVATATSVGEAQAIESAGVDAVVAQGFEAGGHRGVFDLQAEDTRLGTFALTRLLARHVSIPVIAAGGIMDGAGIRAAMELGAEAAQLGTAFILCPESAADQAFRTALQSDAANHTTMTAVISGRPARCLANRFTEWGKGVLSEEIPAYPCTYDAGKALNAAAKAKGEGGFGAQWAGQGAPMARGMGARELVEELVEEIEARSF